MTYDEYFEELNSEAVYKGLSSMTEVASLDIAMETSNRLVKDIKKSGHCRKEDLKTAKYAIAEVKYHETTYIVALFIINGAKVFLRATDPLTKKFYIPNDIWIVGTNNNDENEIYHMMTIQGESEE